MNLKEVIRMSKTRQAIYA